jgi:hypothetical protein
MVAYVKFVEEAGARVVPLIWGEQAEVTLDKPSKLNGVFSFLVAMVTFSRCGA